MKKAKIFITCFPDTARVTFNLLHQKFYYISSNQCEKMTTRRKLSVHFWCIHPHDSAPLIKRRLFSQIFIGTLFFISKSSKKSKFPLQHFMDKSAGETYNNFLGYNFWTR